MFAPFQAHMGEGTWGASPSLSLSPMSLYQELLQVLSTQGRDTALHGWHCTLCFEVLWAGQMPKAVLFGGLLLWSVSQGLLHGQHLLPGLRRCPFLLLAASEAPSAPGCPLSGAGPILQAASRGLTSHLQETAPKPLLPVVGEARALLGASTVPLYPNPRAAPEAWPLGLR